MSVSESNYVPLPGALEKHGMRCGEGKLLQLLAEAFRSRRVIAPATALPIHWPKSRPGFNFR